MTRPWHIWLTWSFSAAVVLMVMGWVTWTTLRLDRLQTGAARTAEQEERIRLALWRLDSWLAPLLIEESARRFTDYEPFGGAPHAYTRGFLPLRPGDVLVPSPLLGPPPDPILLHFQIHRDGRVTSPQVPLDDQRELAEAGYASSEQIEVASGRLAAFRRILDGPANVLAGPTGPDAPGESAGAMARTGGADPVRWLLRETGRTPEIWPFPIGREPEEAVAGGGAAGAGPGAAASLAQVVEQQQFRNETEFNYRANTFQQAQQRLTVQNVIQQFEPGRRIAPGSDPAGGEGLLRAFWLGDALVWVRRVPAGLDAVLQGCWLDWARVRHALLESIRDLLPEADLERVPGSETGNVARRLAGLPVELLPGPATVGAIEMWTPLRRLLLLAWLGILAAGLAVGLLLHGSLSLSERRAAFVSAVTHELRTPLTTFKLYSEMLAGGMVREAAQRQQYLDALQSEADRLGHLVENVLAYARLERGAVPRRAEALPLEELLERVRPRLEARARMAGLELIEELEAAAARTVVRVDVPVVEQILFNLVDNAARHAAPAATRRVVHLEVLL